MCLHPRAASLQVMIGAFPVRASLTVAELCAVVAGAVGLVAPGTPAASTSAVGDSWRLFYRFTSHAAAAPPLPPGHVPPLGAMSAPPPPSAVLAVPVGSGGFAVPLEQFLRPRLLAAPQLLALLAAGETAAMAGSLAALRGECACGALTTHLPVLPAPPLRAWRHPAGGRRCHRRGPGCADRREGTC